MTLRAEGTPKSVWHFPFWWLLLGVGPFVGSVMLAARLIWEQTVWTWERGPQMVGFSLAHGSGAVLFLAPILLIPWVLAAVGMIVWEITRKRKIAWANWLALGLPVLMLILMFLPEGFWQYVFVRQMAKSERAGDLIVYAAYRGDASTVKAMLSHGVPISAIDHSEWRSPLHAAAEAGHLSLIEFLVSKGANVNALDRSGDSPLELATSSGCEECADFLKKHGAIYVRGDEAQHQKAIEDKVRDDIEEMNRLRSQRLDH